MAPHLKTVPVPTIPLYQNLVLHSVPRVAILLITTGNFSKSKGTREKEKSYGMNSQAVGALSISLLIPAELNYKIETTM